MTKIKSKLLTLLLVVCLIIPCMFALVGCGKTDTSIKVASAEEFVQAFADAKDGDVIKLTGDIGIAGDIDHIANRIMVTADVTLELNGHNITADFGAGNENWAIFRIDGGSLIINGNGNVTSTATTGGYCFQVTNGDLTINGGNYVANPTVITLQKGTATINAGSFNCAPAGAAYFGDYRYTLNCIDANYKDGTAQMIVKGGTYYNEYNPANCLAEGPNTNFVADGYESKLVGTTYVVTAAE